MNGGVDVLRHLKNRFILNKMIWWSAHKWRVGRFASCWKTIQFKEKIESAFEYFQHFDFCILFQILCSLEKQKYGFVLTWGKKYSFLDNQNMKDIHDSWINFYKKVRFLGLWKMSFLKKFSENIDHLYYW